MSLEAFKTIYFKNKKAQPNTFIGGIAKKGGVKENAPIDTPFKLSEKLGISVNRISGFNIVGNDIECKIKGEYNLNVTFGNPDPNYANQNITYYRDEMNLCLHLRQAFTNCKSLYNLKLNGVVLCHEGFRGCDNPNLYVEMANVKILYYTIAQLHQNFSTASFSGWKSLETLQTAAFNNVAGFEEINLPNLKTMMGGNNFYAVKNCKKYFLNNLTSIIGVGAWSTGNGACELIEIKKCKTLPQLLIFPQKIHPVPNPTNFTLRVNQAVSGHTSLIAIKNNYPQTIIELYDDLGNFVGIMP